MEIVQDIQVTEDVIRRNRIRVEHLIPNYMVRRLQPGWRVCSAGCGSGYDVELLLKMGFDAWGFDKGARTTLWKDRPPQVQERLRLGYAADRPFEPGTFDYVYALEVIEHVGCENALWKLMPDADEVRRDFLVTNLDLLKPGGRLFLSTSNRLCPIDIGHGHHYHPFTNWIYSRLRLPLTVPWHERNFVLSLNDIRRLLDRTPYAGAYRVETAPITGYLSYTKVRNPIVRAFSTQYLDIINHPALRSTGFNPMLLVEIEKLAAGHSKPEGYALAH